MADQATEQPRAISPALAEPTKHVRAGWVTGLGLASLAMWMASYTPLQVLLPIQLQDITPRHKLAALGVVSAVGAVASVLVTPVAGPCPTGPRIRGASPTCAAAGTAGRSPWRCSARPAW
jgi:hypothetical protein